MRAAAASRRRKKEFRKPVGGNPLLVFIAFRRTLFERNPKKSRHKRGGQYTRQPEKREKVHVIVV